MSIVAVAKKAGVSVSTVARVLKGLPAVSDKTARQVRRAITELGYKQGAARKIKSDISIPGKRASQLVLAIMSLADDSHWRTRTENAKAIAAIMDAARQQGIDARVVGLSIHQLKHTQGGILFVPPEADESELKQLAAKLPLVCIMSAEPCQVRVDHVVTDAAEAGRIACDYLRKAHCDRFAFLTDEPSSKLMHLYARGFARGFARAARRTDFHLIGSGRMLSNSYPGDVECSVSIDAAAEKLCSKGERLGLFTPNRSLASKVCDAMVARGHHIGKDLLVVSCEGDVDEVPSKMPVALITLQPHLVGRLALQQIVHRIAHPSAPTVRVQVPVVLHS